MADFLEWVQPNHGHFEGLFNCTHSIWPSLSPLMKINWLFCCRFWQFLTVPNTFHISVLIKEQSIYVCHHPTLQIQYLHDIWISHHILVKKAKVIYEIFFVKIESLLQQISVIDICQIVWVFIKIVSELIERRFSKFISCGEKLFHYFEILFISFCYYYTSIDQSIVKCMNYLFSFL